eukprot:g5100.t1
MVPMQSPARRRLGLDPMNTPLTAHLSPLRAGRRHDGARAGRSGLRLEGGLPPRRRSQSVYIYRDGEEEGEESRRGEKDGGAEESVAKAEAQEGRLNAEDEREGGAHTGELEAEKEGIECEHDVEKVEIECEGEAEKEDIVGEQGSEKVQLEGERKLGEIEPDNRAVTACEDVKDMEVDSECDENLAVEEHKVCEEEQMTPDVMEMNRNSDNFDDTKSKCNATKACVLSSADLTQKGCIFGGKTCICMLQNLGEFAIAKCTLPTCCLVNCPASILFCCITEDAPDFPHVADWIKKDDARVIYCKDLRRNYRKAKRRLYVWYKQTCCGVRAEAQILSREDRLYEERRIARLEAKKNLRLSRASMIIEKSSQMKEKELETPGKVEEAPPVFRAPPVKPTRSVLTAMDRAIISRRAKDLASGKKRLPKARPNIQNDRFAMVENALEKKCYTTDGRRFFKSKRQLDAHFNRVANAAPIAKLQEEHRRSRVPLRPLEVQDENCKPLAQRNIRKIVAARSLAKPLQKVDSTLRGRNSNTEIVGGFTGEALARLQRKGKKRRKKRKGRKGRVKEDQDDGGDDLAKKRRKHEIYTDLHEVRIAQFQKGLSIFDELYAPGTLRSYLLNADKTFEERTGRNGEFVKRIEQEKLQDTRGGCELENGFSESDDDDDAIENERNTETQHDVGGDDWMCLECGFANSLDLEICQICESERPQEHIEDGRSLSQRIAEAPWSIVVRRPVIREYTKKLRRRLRKQQRESVDSLRSKRDAAARALVEDVDSAGSTPEGEIEDVRVREMTQKLARAEADLNAAVIRDAQLKRDTPPTAAMVPFNKIVEIVAKAEDIRGAQFNTRDTFINLNRTSGDGMGDIAFAIASFFSFGKIVQFVVNDSDASNMDRLWRETKSVLQLRKSSAKGMPENAENVNPMMGRKKKKRARPLLMSMESHVTSWEDYARIHEASICFLNLTWVPETHQKYPKSQMTSKKWRPTLAEAVGAVEDRLSLLDEGSMFILVTRDENYEEKQISEESGDQARERFASRPGSASKVRSRPGTAASSRSRPSTASSAGQLCDYPIEIVGWRLLDTTMYRHDGLAHEDAGTDGVISDAVTGKAAHWCEPDVNTGVWMRMGLYLRENNDDDENEFLAMIGEL